MSNRRFEVLFMTAIRFGSVSQSVIGKRIMYFPPFWNEVYTSRKLIKGFFLCVCVGGGGGGGGGGGWRKRGRVNLESMVEVKSLKYFF